jgi:hypothetical protein
MLRESANKAEKEEGSHWEEEEDRLRDGDSDICSDGELDSMFGTLGP